MANSKITITFNEDASAGHYISFWRNNVGLTNNTPIVETFKLIRSNNYEIEAPPAIDIEGIVSATRFVSAFNIDYNGTGLYTITRLSNVVTIEFTNDSWEFNTFATNAAFITSVIENITLSTFELVSDVQSPNTDICNFWDLTVTANQPIKSLIINGSTVTTDTPNVVKSFGHIRGVDVSVQMIDVNDIVVQVGEYRVDFLSPENISISISKYLIGATVQVNTTNVVGLDLEYSLDNVNWQTSNVFTGQDEGTKFLYVRDQFGCVKSKEYTVSTFSTRKPIVVIPKANSLTFIKQEVIDGYNIFKNENNSFAINDLNNINICAESLYQTNDIIPTQIHTNFNSSVVTVRGESGTETDIPVIKRTSNLNRFQKLDCIYYKYKEGKLGIYFESGNTYDINDVILGTFSLEGNLPDFAIIGQFVTIENIGTYEIKDVLFDDNVSIKKRVIVIDYEYSGEPAVSKAESIYDIQDFEVFEFYIDWSLFGNGIYDVVIANTDPEFDDINHISENVNIATEHKNTLAIEYYNNNNRDVFYRYGIKHFIRVPYLEVNGKPKQSSDINIGDNSSQLTESKVYSVDEIIFDDMVKSMMRKVTIAVSCRNLKCNGIDYIKDGDVSSKVVNNTNIYEVSVDLLESKLNNNIAGNTIVNDVNTSTIDIPTIITDGIGFIKT